MKNLNKLIAGILIILIFFGVIGILVFLKNGGGLNTGNTKIINTPQGSITVKDYTQHPIATTTDAIIIEQNSQFQILNYKVDNSFLITLLAEPIKKARIDAENAFIKDLNISQNQACALKVSVGVPNAVNSNYSGQELGMDFCPNAVALP